MNRIILIIINTNVKKNVIDVDIPFDKPLNNDLVVDTEKRKPEEIALEIINKIKFLN